MLKDGTRHLKEISLSECYETDGKLFYNNRTYVPDSNSLRLRIVCMYYNDLAAGHLGKAKTTSLLMRDYY